MKTVSEGIEGDERFGIHSGQAIRRSARADAASIPIVAMTANAFDSDVKNCLDAGMNAHLAKPLGPVLFFQTLARSISVSQEGRSSE